MNIFAANTSWDKMRSLFAFCIVLAFAACLQAKPLDSAVGVRGLGDIISNCGKSSDHGQDFKIVITPDPPRKGDKLAINASFTLDEQVTGGSITIKAKYGIIPVLDHTYDLCDTLKPVNLTCPIASGSHSLSTSATIPSIVPSGHYTVNAVVVDQNGQEIACFDVDAHI